MTNTITIINPCGKSSLKKAKRKTSKKGKLKMATKRKRRKTRKKSSVKRKRTSSKRRRNPSRKKRTTYKKRSTYKRKRSRRKRNPGFKGIGQYFGRGRMTNALSLLAGIGGGALSKTFALNMFANPLFSRFYGLLAIVAGATLNARGRRKIVKSTGTGLVVFGVYDLLVENVPMLKAYLPSISGPTFLTQADIEAAEDVSGSMNYGRSVMGASVRPGSLSTVGASINTEMDPEIISSDVDIAEALEMSL